MLSFFLSLIVSAFTHCVIVHHTDYQLTAINQALIMRGKYRDFLEKERGSIHCSFLRCGTPLLMNVMMRSAIFCAAVYLLADVGWWRATGEGENE
jgi:hypothetical protein